MSYKRFDPEDIVISSDAITSTLWSGGVTSLTATVYTSSTQEASTAGKFYLNVFQTGSTATGSAVQFAVSYGNKVGSGSIWYNSAINGASPSKTVYGQFQNLVIGDENTDFIFGSITSSEFWAISIDRTRYKEKLFPGSLFLNLKSSGSLASSITLTDNSQYTTTLQFNEAGRVYQLISGSAAGVKTAVNNGITTDGYSANSGSYGWFLPDIGTIILNPKALNTLQISGGISLSSVTGSNATSSWGDNNRIIYSAISSSSNFALNSEETITSQYVFIRARNAEFNYSENPSFISGSTGEVLYDDFINNPQTYITTVGLYNDNNELLAVSKLSRPLEKNFSKEFLIRSKLDYLFIFGFLGKLALGLLTLI